MMLVTARNRPWILGCAIFAAASAYYALELRKSFNEKVQQQHNVNTEAAAFKSSYEGLIPSEQKWEASYPKLGEQVDIFSLYQGLGIEEVGLVSSPDNATVSLTERVTLNNADIGLNRACIGTGGAGFQVMAHSLSGLMDGLEKIVSKKGIEFSSVAIEQNSEGYMVADLMDFCALLRD